MSQDNFALTRRGFASAAGGVGLAGLAGALSPSRAKAARESSETVLPDLSNPRAALIALAKVKGSLSSGKRFGVFEGKVMALAATGEMRPILGTRGVSVAALNWLPTGGFAVAHKELALYFDLATGRPAEAFVNPLNGRKILAPVASADLSVRILPDAISGFAWRMEEGGVSLEEGILAAREQEHGAGRGIAAIRSTRVATHHAAATELADPGADRATTFGGFLRTGPWPAWFAMSQAAGACLYRCEFRSGFPSPNALPGPAMDQLQSNRFWPASLWDEVARTHPAQPS